GGRIRGRTACSSLSLARPCRRCSHCRVAVLTAAVVAAAVLAVTDDGEEDVLKGRLLLDVFDLGGREQLLELGEGAAPDDPAPVEERDPAGAPVALVPVLRREHHRRAQGG